MPSRPALLRNLGLKLFAFAIALSLWFVFSAQRRERISERSYRLPLSLVNIPSRMLIASPLPAAVDVRVRGPFTALRQLDPQKLEAVIDLLNAPAGEKIYRFAAEDINVPQEVEVIAISPSDVRVLLDTRAEKFLPIRASVNGMPAAGFRVAGVEIEPRVARLVGPARTLAKMASISTDAISIDGRQETFSVPATVVAEATGTTVREGQVVTVTVRIEPVAPTPTPAPRDRMRRS